MSADDLVRRAVRVLAAAGASEPNARVVAASLVEADLVGHDSHGVRRLVPYVEAIRAGVIRPAAQPGPVHTRGATAVVDGRRGFGQVAAQVAVRQARRLAARSGVAVVAIRNCNHVGRLGEYVEALADADLVGLAFCNIDPTVAPYGGRERRLGTNPLAWAVPRGRDRPALVVDFATAAVAEGKLALSAARGERVPPGLLIDPDGRDSTDPADFYRGGALLPFGQHKGYGLSVMIEIVGGLLSGAGISSLPGYDNSNGTVLLAIDIGAFMPVDRFRYETEQFCQALNATAPTGDSAVLVPGEKEARTRAERSRDGVRLSEQTRRDLAVLPGWSGPGGPNADHPADPPTRHPPTTQEGSP